MSAFDARLQDARLSVMLDIRHPFSALALRPVLALAEAEGVEINWLPLSAPPLNAPSAAKPGDDRGILHRRFRAQAIAREIEAYAGAQGLTLRDYYRDGDASAADLGWLWVREHHPRSLDVYLRALFDAYWSAEFDASNTGAIASILEALDLPAASFLDWSKEDGPAAAAAVDGELRDFGLFQVPAFVVEDEVFYGRQHLPMIRWILQGRAGRGPI